MSQSLLNKEQNNNEKRKFPAPQEELIFNNKYDQIADESNNPNQNATNESTKATHSPLENNKINLKSFKPSDSFTLNGSSKSQQPTSSTVKNVIIL